VLYRHSCHGSQSHSVNALGMLRNSRLIRKAWCRSIARHITLLYVSVFFSIRQHGVRRSMLYDDGLLGDASFHDAHVSAGALCNQHGYACTHLLRISVYRTLSRGIYVERQFSSSSSLVCVCWLVQSQCGLFSLSLPPPYSVVLMGANR